MSALGISFKFNPFVFGFMLFDFKYIVGIQILFLTIYIVTDKKMAEEIMNSTKDLI